MKHVSVPLWEVIADRTLIALLIATNFLTLAVGDVAKDAHHEQADRATGERCPADKGSGGLLPEDVAQPEHRQHGEGGSYGRP